jgi:hypothetical protein
MALSLCISESMRKSEHEKRLHRSLRNSETRVKTVALVQGIRACKSVGPIMVHRLPVMGSLTAPYTQRRLRSTEPRGGDKVNLPRAMISHARAR